MTARFQQGARRIKSAWVGEISRPQSIERFETLSLLTVILAAAVTAPQIRLEGASSFFFDIVLGSVLQLWLVLMISRRGSSLIRVIYTVLFALGALLMLLASLLIRDWSALDDVGPQSTAVLTANWVVFVVNCCASAIGLWLVWTPSASAWIAAMTEKRKAARSASK